MTFVALGLFWVLGFFYDKNDTDSKVWVGASDMPNTSLNSPSNFNYSNHFLRIAFYTNGKINKPKIDWKGEKGTFSLDKNYVGISIDKNTGVISWDENLPLTTDNSDSIKIIAANSKGSVSTSILYSYLFKKKFKGSFNNYSVSIKNEDYSNITFGSQSIGKISIVKSGSTLDVACYWFINTNNKLICIYKVNGEESRLELDLVYSIETKPYLKGLRRISDTPSLVDFVRFDYQL